MTGQAAAGLLGVNPVVLSQWLHGRRTPGLRAALKIEHLTGIAAESWLVIQGSESDRADQAEASK